MKEINLQDMSVKNAIRIMMEDTDLDQFQKIAKALDKQKSSFQSSLDRNTVRVEDLKKIAALLGYTVKLEKNEDDQ
ncbi:hypothetical protein [Bacillus sp. FJAT-52991]|uniref:HTH cro/C1-type domain-containing protein n=1 Tax=Bacillus kandeliae TaxID=3129297 RepID=A0ABZ2NBQ0_9BACI